MAIFIVKRGGDFIAQVTAKTKADVISALMFRAGKQAAEPEAEISRCNLGKLEKYIVNMPDNPDEIWVSLHVEEVSERQQPAKPNLTEGNCAYCGKNPAEVPDGDHVIARGFFAEAKRNNTVVYIRVPVCKQCNGKKGAIEQDIMTYFATSIKAEHEDAASLFAPGGTFERSFKGGHRPWSSFLQNAKQVWVFYNEAGLWMPSLQVSVDPAKVQEYLEFVIRGLFFYHFKVTLPDYCGIYVSQSRSEDWHRTFQASVQMAGVNADTDGPFDVGDGVFRYLFRREVGQKQIQIPPMWMFSFYNDGLPFSALCMEKRRLGEVLRLDQNTPHLGAGNYVLIHDEGATAVVRPIDMMSDAGVAFSPITIPRFLLALMNLTGTIMDLGEINHL